MLPLHILSFGFVLGVTAIADKDALYWVRGKKVTLDPRTVHAYHVLIWTGLVALVVTGSILFYPMRAHLLGNLLFDIKLIFVAMLMLNAFLIRRVMDLALEHPFAALDNADKRALFASGVISVFSWTCAAAIAFYMFG